MSEYHLIVAIFAVASRADEFLPEVSLKAIYKGYKSWKLYGKNTRVDFSGGVNEADGNICTEREEEVEVVEPQEMSDCTQEIVKQCHKTFVTVYKDELREKCEEVYLKKCKILMRETTYQHKVRFCNRRSTTCSNCNITKVRHYLVG